MSDLIDRQAALKEACRWPCTDEAGYTEYYDVVRVETLLRLPSVKPKKCSEVLQDMMDDDYYLFCRMRVSHLAEKDWEWLIEQVKEMEQKGRKDG